MSIKLISLNVHGDRHWDLIKPFLKREKPDVLCCQEIFGLDARELSRELGFDFIFRPTTLKPYLIQDNKPRPEGIALFSRFPLKNKGSAYYYKPGKKIKKLNATNLETIRKTVQRAVVWGDVENGGRSFTPLEIRPVAVGDSGRQPPKGGLSLTGFTFATTHFTWTAQGLISENQKADIKKLLAITRKLKPHVLAGDFNAPRGFNEVYDELTKHYIDAVPKKYKSSVDLKFHKRSKDPIVSKQLAKYMVDYIFTMTPYRARNVRLVDGLSDHKAVVGVVHKDA